MPVCCERVFFGEFFFSLAQPQMLAISTAACSSLLLPCSRAHVASARRRGLDAPLLGVPGFVSWLETHSPEALVEMPALPRENSEITPRDVDVVAFDLNSLVHNALRNARDEDQAIAMVFQMLHSALRQVQPRPVSGPHRRGKPKTMDGTQGGGQARTAPTRSAHNKK